MLLEDEGFQVRTASDGREALHHLATERPALVLLDLGLPDMPGRQVGDAVRQRYGPGVPVVVVSAALDARRVAKELGAVACLNKLFDPDSFTALLHPALAESQTHVTGAQSSGAVAASRSGSGTLTC